MRKLTNQELIEGICRTAAVRKDAGLFVRRCGSVVPLSLNVRIYPEPAVASDKAEAACAQ